MLTNIRLEKVHNMPKTLEPGVLYVSAEFKTAAHLCACGCGEKVRTPLTATEWSFKETRTGPSLYPSIGNWQKPCRSHYWITSGRIVWAGHWTEEEILSGRAYEQEKREQHYARLHKPSKGWLVSFLDWLISALKKF